MAAPTISHDFSGNHAIAVAATRFRGLFADFVGQQQPLCLFSTFQAPHADAIIASREQSRAIGNETVHGRRFAVDVDLHSADLAQGIGLPDNDVAVLAGRYQLFAFPGERQGRDCSLVTVTGGELFAILHTSQFDGAVFIADCELRPVGRKDHRAQGRAVLRPAASASAGLKKLASERIAIEASRGKAVNRRWGMYFMVSLGAWVPFALR